ncbi:MAG: DotA/TraY family protein [Deltaproteobacteria bacterium]|jgi:conjugal transfer/type IV secretion protein DotA/TraY|nr:DotA/TraY family protein [Deltaproteobacteria bacterium]
MSDIPQSSQVPAGDLAGRVIDGILGTGWDTVSGAQGAGAAATLAREALGAFNWLALAAVTALFVLTMLQGLAGTAAEGVPLGRRFSCLWMPLRFAAAMGFLAPVAKGLSLFQVGMLLCVGWSVNLANHVWERGLDFFVESGGRISVKAPQSVADDSRRLAEGVLKALTVQAYLARKMDLENPAYAAEEAFFPPAGNSSGRMVVTFSTPEAAGLPPGALGRTRIPCADPSEAACRARLSALRGLCASLGETAALLADPLEEITRARASALSAAVEGFQAEIQPWAEMAEGDGEARLKADLGEFREAALSGGWLTAGAYYWTVSRLNERSRRAIYETAEFTEGQASEALDGAVMEDFGAVTARYGAYVRGAYSPERAAAAAGVPAEFPSAAWFSDVTSGALGRYGLSRLVSQLEDGDPVAVMSSLGSFLVASAETVMGVRVAVMAAASAAEGADGSLWGRAVGAVTGGATSAAAGLVRGAAAGMAPYMLLLSILLISYGFFLAYFLPALPFVLWISGALSWLVLVVESLAAAPLWLAAHALPDGEGLAGAHGRRGYMMFLAVVLRPPLMVFGFLLAMALVNGLGRVVGRVFSVFGFAFLEESFLGVSGFLAFAVILGAVTVTAVWKLFGLMCRLPDRVTAWIGSQVGPGGEDAEGKESSGSYREAGVLATRMADPLRARVIRPPAGRAPGAPAAAP